VAQEEEGGGEGGGEGEGEEVTELRVWTGQCLSRLQVGRAGGREGGRERGREGRREGKQKGSINEIAC
jgi:hypothetical protein